MPHQSMASPCETVTLEKPFRKTPYVIGFLFSPAIHRKKTESLLNAGVESTARRQRPFE